MKRIQHVVSKSFAGKKVFLVNFRERRQEDTDESIRELELLCYTLKLKIDAKFLVKLNYIHPSTYLGEGKLAELKKSTDELKPSFIIFANDLSSIQQRNIEKFLGVQVIDRTGLILQIFGEHAKSSEGKIQIELAQLDYILPRLTGYGTELSRIGGGFATKGPGEMKLEVNRRRIKERIYKLKREIKDIAKHRKLIRDSKRRKNFPMVALMGYTNVGKSRLMNSLSASELYVANKLFATLDPATRAVYIGEGKFCLLSDTVGLLHNIPHNLIEAFQSTLEEVKYADLILILYDISAKNLERQRKTVFEAFEMLGIKDRKTIEVYNKIDLLSPEEKNIIMSNMSEGIFVSAFTGEGIENLKEVLKENLYGSKTEGSRQGSY
ncbi:MAG TPA: GTPase HflX [bacterium]|nr:GTPase HflX [bacterium]